MRRVEGRLAGVRSGAPHASVRVRGTSAHVQLDVTCRWPAPVTRIAADVRAPRAGSCVRAERRAADVGGRHRRALRHRRQEDVISRRIESVAGHPPRVPPPRRGDRGGPRPRPGRCRRGRRSRPSAGGRRAGPREQVGRWLAGRGRRAAWAVSSRRPRSWRSASVPVAARVLGLVLVLAGLLPTRGHHVPASGVPHLWSSPSALAEVARSAATVAGRRHSQGRPRLARTRRPRRRHPQRHDRPDDAQHRTRARGCVPGPPSAPGASTYEPLRRRAHEHPSHARHRPRASAVVPGEPSCSLRGWPPGTGGSA